MIGQAYVHVEPKGIENSIYTSFCGDFGSDIVLQKDGVTTVIILPMGTGA